MAQNGSTYFYNLFNEPAKLSLNGGTAGNINGWDPSKGYEPANVKVGGALHSDQNTGLVYRGGDGANELRIDWESGYSTATITFPTTANNVRIGDDLVCYVAKNMAFVQTVDGFVIGDSQKLKFHAPG